MCRLFNRPDLAAKGRRSPSMLEAKQRGKPMPDHKVRNRIPEKERDRRIQPKDAAKILKQCESFLADSSELLKNLREAGFGRLLAQIDETILRLAMQPDSWGERTKARLMSDIAPALQGDLSVQNSMNVDDIAHCANIIMPCLLLELGRRQQHIEIEFPLDPTDSSARFRFRLGKPIPVPSITNHHFVPLAP